MDPVNTVEQLRREAEDVPLGQGPPHNVFDHSNFITFGVVNTFRYTNYKGETELRKVIPLYIKFGTTDHHPDLGEGGHWLLHCVDMTKLDSGVFRTFAFKDIHPR